MSVFNEDTRVKISATIQFLRLDYNYQSLKDSNAKIDEEKLAFESPNAKIDE